MAESNQQAQESRTSNETNNNEQSTKQGTTRPFNTEEVPEYRFEEINRKKKAAEDRAKAAEQRLQEIEQEREQQQEERQQKQGEYQELADKRQKKIQKLEDELKQVKAEWTRERRMNVWNRAAQGVVKQDAISDAFSFLSEDDLSNIDDSDESSFKQLAQNLVEVRSYLAVDGARGAGSGGSDRPVMVGAKDGSKQLTNGRQPIFHKPSKRKRPWK